MAKLATLDQTATQILELFAEQLEDLVELPERQYVAPGNQIVWDGEQLTVALMGIAQGQPSHQEPQTFVPQAVHYYATFAINLVRTISVITTNGFVAAEIPSAAEMGADGTRLVDDAAALVTVASSLHAAYALTDPGEGYAMEGTQPLGPEGGMAGTRLLLSVSLT